MLNETITDRVRFGKFEAVQANETLDVTYLVKHKRASIRHVWMTPYKNGWKDSLLCQKDKTDQGLATVIFIVLKDRAMDNKLICETYDRTSV